MERERYQLYIETRQKRNNYSTFHDVVRGKLEFSIHKITTLTREGNK
jgi:hypothetical protein